MSGSLSVVTLARGGFGSGDTLLVYDGEKFMLRKVVSSDPGNHQITIRELTFREHVAYRIGQVRSWFARLTVRLKEKK